MQYAKKKGEAMSVKASILLVEDNEAVSETVVENLTEEGYKVVVASSAKEVNAKLKESTPDVVLLDLGLPDADGLQLIKIIREFTNAPIIVISGKSDMVDKIVGLEMGADDYIGKPLQMKEVAARIKAQLRRYKSQQPAPAAPPIKNHSSAVRIKFGDWILDRQKFQVFNLDGNSANLTIKEFRLLEALILASNRVLTREQLLDKARDGDYNTTDRAVDVQILRMRKKIGDTSDNPKIIKAVRGVGYTLDLPIEILC